MSCDLLDMRPRKKEEMGDIIASIKRKKEKEKGVER